MKKLKELCTENLVAIAMLLFTVLFPIFNSAYKVDQFTGFYITCFLTFSIVLIWGYTGIFSFGQAAFYGIGAYTYAIISLCSDKNLTIVAALAGTLIAGIAATLLGYFIFYGGVDEIFTGIITLCVSIILETFIVQTSGPEYKMDRRVQWPEQYPKTSDWRFLPDRYFSVFLRRSNCFCNISCFQIYDSFEYRICLIRNS